MPWASEGLALALLKLQPFLRVSSPQGQGTMSPELSTRDPRIPCPTVPRCTSRACMGLLTGSVLSIDRTTDVCICPGCGLDCSVVWCSVEGLVKLRSTCTVKVLLEYDRAGGGKRRGLGAHRPTYSTTFLPKLRSDHEESECEPVLPGCFKHIFVKVGDLYFTVCWLDL